MSSLILSGQLPTTWLVSTNQLARQQIEKEGETVEKISWSSGTKTRTNLPTTSSHQQTNYPTCYQANQQKKISKPTIKKMKLRGWCLANMISGSAFISFLLIIGPC